LQWLPSLPLPLSLHFFLDFLGPHGVAVQASRRWIGLIWKAQLIPPIPGAVVAVATAMLNNLVISAEHTSLVQQVIAPQLSGLKGSNRPLPLGLHDLDPELVGPACGLTICFGLISSRQCFKYNI
jgi:hypothetical protein